MTEWRIYDATRDQQFSRIKILSFASTQGKNAATVHISSVALRLSSTMYCTRVDVESKCNETSLAWRAACNALRENIPCFCKQPVKPSHASHTLRKQRSSQSLGCTREPTWIWRVQIKIHVGKVKMRLITNAL